ncbi:MAG: ABC transporter ATP-binding protein [Alteromonadaceae bacterium]|nr:MAG: ABC transporter ATP-binding protein [Alteromonadaceae bacterium]
MSLIKIDNLKKHYKVLNRREGLGGAFKDLFSGNYRTVKAVDDISLSIDSGEMVAFLGPNGAGKSTAIKMMVGALKPTSGDIIVDGFEPFKDRKDYVQNIGVVLGQRPLLWWDIPVIESFKILKKIYRVNDADYQRNIDLYHSITNLDGILNMPVRNLSLGQRSLCNILAVFLHNPKVIFLDEPTIGLDVAIKLKMRELIKALNKTYNTTVILTSHDVGDVESLCDRISLIDKGHILFDDSIENFHKYFNDKRTIRVKVDADSIDSSSAGEQGLLSSYAKSLESKINQTLRLENGVKTSLSPDGWLDVSFSEDETDVMSVLNCIMAEASVSDVKLNDTNMEELMRRSYESFSPS